MTGTSQTFLKFSFNYYLGMVSCNCAGRNKDTLKGPCTLPFGYPTIDTIIPKKLQFSRESMLRGEMNPGANSKGSLSPRKRFQIVLTTCRNTLQERLEKQWVRDGQGCTLTSIV